MATLHEVGLPVRAALHADALYLAFKNVDVSELRDPFMFQTMRRVAGPTSVVRIDRRRLDQEQVGSPPLGLIFHVGRCGSTLLSQLLKQHEVAVYGEPLPFNEALSPPLKWRRSDVVAALRTIGAAFSRHAGKPYVLKFTSWVTLYADIVTEAFPRSPWAFSVRDPVEVGVSYMNDTPRWFWGDSDYAQAFAWIVNPERKSQSKEEHFARLFGAYCAAIERLDARRGTLIRYESLPDAVWRVLSPHFSLSVDATLRQRMAEASRLHAKRPPEAPQTEFVPDAAIKRAGASQALVEAVNVFSRPALQRLFTRFSAAS